MNNWTYHDPIVEEALKKLLSLSEAAELSGLSQGHLRLLITKGLLWGTKIGPNWVTTREALEAYLVKERKPGPKPKTPDTTQG